MKRKLIEATYVFVLIVGIYGVNNQALANPELNSFESANRHTSSGQSTMQTGTSAFIDNSNAMHDENQNKLKSDNLTFTRNANYQHDQNQSMRQGHNADFINYSNARHDAKQDALNKKDDLNIAHDTESYRVVNSELNKEMD